MGKNKPSAVLKDNSRVRNAVAELLAAVKDNGVLTFAQIFQIIWQTLDFSHAWKIVLAIVALITFGGTIGWYLHVSSLLLFPEQPVAPQVARASMPEVLAARAEFIADKAPDWMYPIVRTLEGTLPSQPKQEATAKTSPAPASTAQEPKIEAPKRSGPRIGAPPKTTSSNAEASAAATQGPRTVFQVSAKFGQPTQAGRVQLIRQGSELTGFAFLVRLHADGKKSYEPLSRMRNDQRRFVVDVPEANAGDELVFLTALPGTFKKSELNDLFSIRSYP